MDITNAQLRAYRMERQEHFRDVVAKLEIKEGIELPTSVEDLAAALQTFFNYGYKKTEQRDFNATCSCIEVLYFLYLPYCQKAAEL